MFLKSLVMRGFKSFAEKTTLEFAPGISVIVGPNGSGKTNIQESISWVLGEQGPKSLRGGKMEDVIFAGSKLRPALGMAEVTLTIDNSAGLLPIEFDQVSISRSLFRSGESEYRLNGAVCRLLDIQEVLSDSGIGREQHTIIGQGQLDEILQADPLQTRGFIEEAAGVTKHRRRKERALRKIDAAEENLSRLSDLLGEIRRQLRPLREQAEVAKRHTAMAEELQRVQVVQAARELAGLSERLGSGTEADPEGPLREKEAELTELEERLGSAERRRAEVFADIESKREVAWDLARAHERLASLIRLAAERSRSLNAELAGASEDVHEARIADVRREVDATTASLDEARELERSSAQRSSIPLNELKVAEDKISATEEGLGPRRSAHRESLSEAIRIRSEISTLERSIAVARTEASHISNRRSEVSASLQSAQQELDQTKARLTNIESSEDAAAQALEELGSVLRQIEERHRLASSKLHETQTNAASWQARAETRPASRAAAERIVGLDLPGVVGILGNLVETSDEYRLALDAIAGPAESVLVAEPDALGELLDRLQADDPVAVLVADQQNIAAAPELARSITDVVTITDARAASSLAGIFVTDSVAEAADQARKHPDLVFVSKDGGLASGSLVVRTPSDVAEQARRAVDEADAAERALAKIETELGTARIEHETRIAKVNEADAELAAVAETISAFERDIHALEAQLDALTDTADSTKRAEAEQVQRLESLRQRLPEIESRIEAEELEVRRLQESHGAGIAERQAALTRLEDARMETARASERTRLLDERLSHLRGQLEKAEREAEGLEQRREHLTSAIERVGRISETASHLEPRSQEWANEAEETYQSGRLELETADRAVERIRYERSALVGAIEDLRQAARKGDVMRNELRFRMRILEERMRNEWGADPEDSIRRYGHIWEVEDESRLVEPIQKVAAMDQESLTRKRTRLERDLEGIGRVNPLASQEFDSLTEREAFLGQQIADVRSSRRHLLKVVETVDSEVRELFIQAFEDVAREYERLFTLLFPGGQGRLRMTDPNDPLETGVEVEARPGGKNLRRLSLLSGGERALSALALLFAIFRARPSPFYVLDEVEAALDDINLHRFLQLLMEFRKTSQLLVVTHQKRTMEIADVLYGVSIKPDGASRVISERIETATQPEIESLQPIRDEG